jgi:hypothetical protein
LRDAEVRHVAGTWAVVYNERRPAR